MNIKIKLICTHCHEENMFWIAAGKLNNICPSCRKSTSQRIHPYPHSIYIAKAPGKNRYKIGTTSQLPSHRVKSLNRNGHSGQFKLIAFWPSKNGKQDERKLHEKLRQYRREGEIFEIDLITAIFKGKAVFSRFPEGCTKTLLAKIEEERLRRSRDFPAAKPAVETLNRTELEQPELNEQLGLEEQLKLVV